MRINPGHVCPVAWLLAALNFSLLLNFQAAAAGIVTVCDEPSLRAAMIGGGIVKFECDGTITLANTLTITNDTTIDATDRSIVLSGGGALRVLLVQTTGKLTLKGLSIEQGYSTMGGGMRNEGEATLVNCTFKNNVAPESGPNGFGGGIYDQGTKLRVNGTTFSHNQAAISGSAISCGQPGLGGVNGDVAITNCTFFANGPGAVGFAAGLLNPATIVNCTFAWNTNGTIGHATYLPDAPVRLLNSIVAYTVGGVPLTGVEDLGYNLSSDNDTNLTHATSVRNTNPLLGPLTNNGGPTETMALLAGSPAIDTLPFSSPLTDQRGVARPFGLKADMGAFEGTANPAHPSTVRFASTNYPFGEAQGNALIQVQRTGTSQGNVSVGISTTPGSAAAGVDYTPTEVVLSFADGEMQKYVSVPVLNDLEAENTETVLLTLHDAVGTTLDTPNSATLTILDDEQGTPATNTCTDAGLREAINQGGTIRFTCDGTVVLTNTIMVTKPTVLDANGHDVVISGADRFRLFHVSSGVSFTLKDLTLAHGRDQGTGGSAGAIGGEGRGGAILSEGGTIELFRCRFQTNTAVGGVGGSLVSSQGGPPGGTGAGGAIYLNGGSLMALDCSFLQNVALGGTGGTGGASSPPAGTGGMGHGGSIYNMSGQLLLTNCTLLENRALGGEGGGAFSAGGDSAGGAIFSAGTEVFLHACLVSTNQSISGRGRRFGSPVVSSGMASGAAIEISGGVLRLVSSTFTDNTTRALWSTVARGGAVTLRTGSLQASDCLFLRNSVSGGDGAGVATPFGLLGGPGFGGSLFLLAGSAAITNSSFVENSAVGGSQVYGSIPGAGAGGAVYNRGSLQLVNCTVTENRAEAGYNDGRGMQGGAFGGGLYNDGGTLTLHQVTISQNGAIPDGTNSFQPVSAANGGGIYSTNGSVTVLNTILANNNWGSNYFGTLVDNGHNLSSDSSGNFTNLSSLKNTDPHLGPLGYYGGLTPTLPLLAGSPAIDGGDSTSFTPVDQRGRPRPYGATPDIGAYESSAPYFVLGQISGFTFKDPVDVKAGSAVTTTTNHGRFLLEGLAAGTYSVTPQSADYLFLPSERSVTITADHIGVGFNAYRWTVLSLEGVTTNTLHLIFAGTEGQTYRLLESGNLVDWQPVATNTIGTSKYFESFIPMDSGPPHLYRTVSP